MIRNIFIIIIITMQSKTTAITNRNGVTEFSLSDTGGLYDSPNMARTWLTPRYKWEQRCMPSSGGDGSRFGSETPPPIPPFFLFLPPSKQAKHFCFVFMLIMLASHGASISIGDANVVNMGTMINPGPSVHLAPISNALHSFTGEDNFFLFFNTINTHM